ncbi:MAG: hypothetical protein JJU35_08990 [Balneolales bacterium]|nr:hypothetical protein [Balneolales bacterium]
MNNSVPSVLKTILLLVFLAAAAQPAQAQLSAGYYDQYYTISNPGGMYDFQAYESLTFRQEVISRTETEIVLRVRTAKRAPQQMGSPYPVQALPDTFAPYLSPTSWIQSEDARIARIAAEIREAYPNANQHDLVYQVMLWNARHLQYGDPSGIHDAIYALENRVVNCIGYAHLPAALLRNLGIPARVVRTFVHRYPSFTRHYLLEVYYPEEDVWLTLEPQTISAPFNYNVFLYHDSDWNQQKHLVSRAFSIDPQTTVRLGLLSELPEVHETLQMDRPEPEISGHRRLIGQEFAVSGNTMVATAYRNQTGSFVEPEGYFIHLFIWERDENGLRFVQEINPEVVVPESFPRTTFRRIQRSPIFQAGVSTGFGYGSRGWIEERPAISDRFLVYRVNGINNIFKPFVFWEKAADGSWQYHSTFAYPDEWGNDFHEGPGYNFPAFHPDGDLYIAGIHGIVRMTLENNSWVPKEYIPKRNKDGMFAYGRSIAFNESGDRMIVGAPGRFTDDMVHNMERPTDRGYAEIFRRRAGGWVSAGVVQASDGHTGDQFGFSVAASGDRFIVGAPLNHAAGEEAGAAYIFEEDRATNRIRQTAVLRPASAIANDQHGTQVALRGMQAWVSAHQKATTIGNRGGGIFYFELEPSGQWAENKLFAPGTIIRNTFSGSNMNTHLINAGFTLALWDDELVAGAPGHSGWPDARTNNYGTFYFFEAPPAPESPRLVTDAGTALPAETALIQASPNPLFSASEITFDLSDPSEIELYLTPDENAGLRHGLFSGALEAGRYQIRLDASGLPAGQAQLHLRSGNTTHTLPLLILNPEEAEEVI